MSVIAEATCSIKFSSPYQVSSFFQHHFFSPFYLTLNHVAQKSPIVQWVSPFIGITDGIAKLITIIGSIFEAAIKGIGNLAIGVITFNTSLLRDGSLMFVSLIPVRVISILPQLLFTLLLTIYLTLDPEEATRKEAEWHHKKQVFF